MPRIASPDEPPLESVPIVDVSNNPYAFAR